MAHVFVEGELLTREGLMKLLVKRFGVGLKPREAMEQRQRQQRAALARIDSVCRFDVASFPEVSQAMLACETLRRELPGLAVTLEHAGG